MDRSWAHCFVKERCQKYNPIATALDPGSLSEHIIEVLWKSSAKDSVAILWGMETGESLNGSERDENIMSAHGGGTYDENLNNTIRRLTAPPRGRVSFHSDIALSLHAWKCLRLQHVTYSSMFGCWVLPVWAFCLHFWQAVSGLILRHHRRTSIACIVIIIV